MRLGGLDCFHLLLGEQVGGRQEEPAIFFLVCFYGLAVLPLARLGLPDAYGQRGVFALFDNVTVVFLLGEGVNREAQPVHDVGGGFFFGEDARADGGLDDNFFV